MRNIRFLDILRSTNAILAVLVLALVAQIPHAADVFRAIGHATGWLAYIHSYFFAIALELAVLVFVVQNRQNESYGFAGVSIAMNLSYYYINDVPLFSPSALPSWLVSIALPAAIALYSHVVVDAQPHVATVPAEEPAPPLPTVQLIEHPRLTDNAPPQLEQPTDIAQPESNDTPPLQLRIELMRSEGLDNKTIALQLSDVTGYALAKALGVHPSNISRWRNKAQSNGHTMEVAQ